jgi:hypothetical protein
MIRPSNLTILLVMGSCTFLHADPMRFQFQKEQKLVYQVEQTTIVKETVVDEKAKDPAVQTSQHTLSLRKQWRVLEVEPNGTAKLELSILSMKIESKRGDEAPTIFDSTKPDAENRAELTKMIGQPLAILKLDTRGQIVEVIESKYGSASKFVTDLPFKVVLPDVEKPTWDRAYQVKMDPPQGTGESYDAVQNYNKKPDANALQVIGMSTTFKNLPEAAIEQIPVLSMIAEGDVFVHAASGKYVGARLKMSKQLKGHQGEGSIYDYQSSYREDIIPEGR